MKKIFDLDEWHLDRKIPDARRTASVTVYLKYIDLKKVINLTSKQRVTAIDKHFKETFSKLLKINLFDNYELIGSRTKPRGVDATIKIKDIEQLAKYSFV